MGDLSQGRESERTQGPKSRREDCTCYKGLRWNDGATVWRALHMQLLVNPRVQHPLGFIHYIYIYIFREREREREGEHFPGGSDGKESACNAGGLGSILLEKEMATHSSILAWRIP